MVKEPNLLQLVMFHQLGVATPDTAIDIRGYEGLSAYDVATKNNFSGTEEWLKKHH